jgi:hypothetical protein
MNTTKRNANYTLKTNTIPNTNKKKKVIWIAVYCDSNKLQLKGQSRNNPLTTAMF